MADDDTANAEAEEIVNKDPAFIGALFSNVTELLQLYGWFILIAVGALYFLYSKIQPWLDHVSKQREEDQYKKLDKGHLQSRMEAMEKARLKMQAELDAQAKDFAEQQKIKEEKKRQEKLEDWERHLQGQGYRNKTKVVSSFSLQSSMEAMEKARLKMQAELDAKAKAFAEQQKISERQDPPSTLVKPKTKKPLRPADYNPLSGSDGGACYRPSRKGGASGGG